MVPWLHRFTNEQGLHQLCCSGDGDANALCGADGKPLHVSQGMTDREFLNSPGLKRARREMMAGEWPAACVRCQQAENAGAVSVRNHINKRFGRWSRESLANTDADGTLHNPQVRFADIRLGNVCNLTCRMCGPKASHLWTEFYNDLQPRRFQFPAAELVQLRDNNWVKRQPIQWLMEQCLPSVESLHFAGGEPLIIPEVVELLEACIRSGRAHEIALSYNTNLTVLPEKVTRLWPRFRAVSLLCSIDGYGALNDYIRRPSSWKDIDRNLHLLDTHFEEWKLRTVQCNTTVQIYNILQLDELFDYLATEFKHIAPAPQLTPLYGPSYLSIQVLPPALKQVISTRLRALKSKAENRSRVAAPALLSSIDTVLAHMEGEERRGELAEFLYFSEKSDRRFGDSWRSACPELARLLSGNTNQAGARSAENLVTEVGS
jgi:sulfatase maturation enzyme AslB (radical SAM superfamily)